MAVRLLLLLRLRLAGLGCVRCLTRSNVRQGSLRLGSQAVQYLFAVQLDGHVDHSGRLRADCPAESIVMVEVCAEAARPVTATQGRRKTAGC